MRLLASILIAAFGVVGLQAPAQAADRDCSHFSSQRAAQLFFLSNYPAADPHGLDADGDGVVCESLGGPSYYGQDPTPGGDDAAAPAPAPAAVKVVKVLDGELVKVRKGARRPYVVHLMGVDVPRNRCRARAAVRDLRSWVKPGMKVRVLVDKKAPKRDKRGNVLRYLVRVKGNYDIGGSQISSGHAQVERGLRFQSKRKYTRWERKAARADAGYHGAC